MMTITLTTTTMARMMAMVLGGDTGNDYDNGAQIIKALTIQLILKIVKTCLST